MLAEHGLSAAIATAPLAGRNVADAWTAPRGVNREERDSPARRRSTATRLPLDFRVTHG